MTNDMEPPLRPRLVPDRAMPPYAYVPGRQPHPVRDPRGHSFGRAPDTPDPPDPRCWRACPAYLYGVDLFNHGYYWEAHEAWEALWHACGRRGPAGTFFKALIGLAAAGLKVRMGNPRGVRGHAQLAANLFKEIALGSHADEARYMGLDLHALSRRAGAVAERPPVGEDAGSSAGAVVFDFVLRPE